MNKIVICKHCGALHRIVNGQYYCSKVFGGTVIVPKKMKSKMKPTPKKETVRMEFETYVYIKKLLEQSEAKLHRDYLTALEFIPAEPFTNYEKTGTFKAADIFRNESEKLSKMKKELHSAAGATYKDHPNIEMRKVWGLDE